MADTGPTGPLESKYWKIIEVAQLLIPLIVAIKKSLIGHLNPFQTLTPAYTITTK
jgi:hypothetical protein